MKAWDVAVNDQTYHVEMKGSKIIVNGTTMKLKDLKKERKMHYGTWEVPLGNATAILYGAGWVSGTAQRLVMNGVDVATGETYAPVGKLPVWAYIFDVLHAINFINGAIGAGLAVLGISINTSIASNEKYPTAIKLLLCLVVLVLSYLLVFGIAFAIAYAVY
ncbi:MAG: hypothetical protein ACRDBO_02700 [Lachnospiraceae bacterium]